MCEQLEIDHTTLLLDDEVQHRVHALTVGVGVANSHQHLVHNLRDT